MVVIDSPSIAALCPPAERAVGHGVRVGAPEPALELINVVALHTPVVGGEVREREALALTGAEHDVNALGWRALDPGEQLGVDAELHDEVRLRRPGQLCVYRLVAPVAELGRRLDALEEVRMATPR